jgi:hypothetical protein
MGIRLSPVTFGRIGPIVGVMIALPRTGPVEFAES